GRNSPSKAHQINLQRSLIARELQEAAKVFPHIFVDRDVELQSYTSRYMDRRRRRRHDEFGVLRVSPSPKDTGDSRHRGRWRGSSLEFNAAALLSRSGHAIIVLRKPRQFFATGLMGEVR